MADIHILNKGKIDKGLKEENVDGELMLSMKTLIAEHVNPVNGLVDYDEMKMSSAYRDFSARTRLLRHYRLETLRTREQRMAFFLNVYNTLVMHGVAKYGEADTLPRKHRLFRTICYEIGGIMFTPDDIEHGILRGNGRAPYWPSKQFLPWDERRRYYVKPVDPRVHFALCCGFVSCPPVRYYTADEIHDQLDAASAAYLSTPRGCRIDRENNHLYLTKLFLWYWHDFGGRKNLLEFVAKCLPDDDSEWILEEQRRLNIKWIHWDFNSNRA